MRRAVFMLATLTPFSLSSQYDLHRIRTRGRTGKGPPPTQSTRALAREGVGLVVIAQLLGHASTRMTPRCAHLYPATLRAAIESLPGRRGLGGGCDLRFWPTRGLPAALEALQTSARAAERCRRPTLREQPRDDPAEARCCHTREACTAPGKPRRTRWRRAARTGEGPSRTGVTEFERPR